MDGSPLEYDSTWASGEPNDYGSGEDCIHTNWSSTGYWNDYVCSNDQPFICGP